MAKYAFLIAGTQSGCGKTTISLALMAAFKDRGLRVQPFKVGPDFIDPGLHTQITGRESRNLDGWMLKAEYNRNLFQRLLAQCDMAVVEGVMGLFDGYDGISESGSSAQMSKWLGLPVILVVDARSMARSAAALVYGFARFDSHVNLAGVIFNRIGGEGHLQYLKEAMASNLPDIPVLGGIPREDLIRIPERHLGLMTADEMQLNGDWEERLASLVKRCVDLDSLLQHAQYQHEGRYGEEDHVAKQDLAPQPLITVARDAAFCFYYPDNLELLRRSGARLHFFSPLAGENFPGDTAGLYLGGGYPELFAENLAGQTRFLEGVRQAFASGMPIYAECGGLMVLSRFIETGEGVRFPMAGILPFGTRMLGRRKALGYTEVILRQPTILGDQGLRLRGHEFHYSEITGIQHDPSLSYGYEIQNRRNGKMRLEGYMSGSVLASYVHLHWGSAPEAPRALVNRCRGYHHSRMMGKGISVT